MPQRVLPAEQGIVLDSLSAGYGQTLIVDNIHLTIPHGKMTVLAGANGSGKSTLLSTIARMLKPLGGCEVVVAGLGRLPFLQRVFLIAGRPVGATQAGIGKAREGLGFDGGPAGISLG